MKHYLIHFAMALSLSLGGAHAADETVKTPQQNKMATCNKDAADKKGDERKAFMKDCLSAEPAASAMQTAQQEKMKSCNEDAGEKKLKSAERKTFMKECLSA